MNSYERHKQAVGQNLYLFYSTKEIFGKQVKDRLFRKWHHRYMRERNRDIKRLGHITCVNGEWYCDYECYCKTHPEETKRLSEK